MSDEENNTKKESIVHFKPIIPPPPQRKGLISIKQASEDIEKYLQNCEEGKERLYTYNRLPFSLQLQNTNICENKLKDSLNYHKVKLLAKSGYSFQILRSRLRIKRTVNLGIALLNEGIADFLIKLAAAFSQGKIEKVQYIQLLHRVKNLSKRNYALMQEVNV